MYERLSAADVNGTLCIRHESPDYVSPKIVTQYWPTRAKTWDFLRAVCEFEEMKDRDKWPALLATFTVVQSRSGEYFIGRKQSHHSWAAWKDGCHVSLTEGGQTLSILTESREAKPPKVRKGIMVYWSGGKWVKHLKKGVENIDPLGVA